MLIGFAVPVAGPWATPANQVRIARRAEELGYHSLWTLQRLLVPVGGDPRAETYRNVGDPLVTLAYLAGLTSRIRLGVAVVNLPFYSPVLLAKQAATLDQVSGGRLELGLGLGWMPQEFTATGASMQRRGARAEEFLAALRSLWTEEISSYAGEFYTIPPSRLEPKPLQRPAPPILLGGKSAPALRRAGRLADGWISSSTADLTTIGEQIELVRTAAAEAGRDPDALRFVCRGAVRVRPDAGADRPPLTGSYEQLRADFADLAAQGVTELFVDLNFDPQLAGPDADPAAAMERAEETLEALRPAG
ncbi:MULTISPECIES: TIGR03619 family F420-dependent LLM class oxidoreductase [Thermomonospora]|uniref:Luciferase-like monooxygenase n=1 Tax=Thermomonospora curvata (strain ATCC 19995 / DSM 43183 / JCM 3096 / KCTC 9072 / NBRC 15933 / NCIMB 10081 / Henssen B9) TaxID=471852 RepID=D1A2V2_THECD|nr:MULTISPECIES: TIGR03619 family F420-dependent LLM class oxidoreductase [Thermomonospora]ACY97900.1 Luciferase-like monooxygenase [Thermomonospora curvata DSM 43183]PKK14180.1 MAG: TIGR03619 family F420-dependent LLM class oxidoreductase [Thermomonospora sp. CIF 1]